MLIVGGDITGKLIVPIVHVDRCYRSYLFGKELTLSSSSEIVDLVKQTEVLGVYPHTFEPDEYEAFKSNPATQDKLFKSLALKRLEQWMEIAAEKLHGAEIRCYVSPGNDDFDECMAVTRSCAGTVEASEPYGGGSRDAV